MTGGRWLRSPAWGMAALATAGGILGSLWKAPTLWLDHILPLLQPHVTAWYVGVGVEVALGLLLWSLRASPRRRLESVPALGAVFAGYALLLFLYYAGEAPAKKFHLLEYGVLAGVTLQAVHVDEERPMGLIVGLVFLFVIGTVDETAQKYIPMRTFRWLDIFGNYVGSALGALGWAAASPHSPWRRQRPAGPATAFVEAPAAEPRRASSPPR